MCRNGIGDVQLESRYLDAYKRSYVHRLFDETNSLTIHALELQAFQDLH